MFWQKNTEVIISDSCGAGWDDAHTVVIRVRLRILRSDQGPVCGDCTLGACQGAKLCFLVLLRVFRQLVFEEV